MEIRAEHPRKLAGGRMSQSRQELEERIQDVVDTGVELRGPKGLLFKTMEPLTPREAAERLLHPPAPVEVRFPGQEQALPLRSP